MLFSRLRSLLTAVLAGAALAGLVLFTVAAQPGRAQAAREPISAPVAAGPLTPTLRLYLPLVVRYVAPCSVAPLLLTPTNQSLLDNIIPTMSYLRQTQAVSATRLQLATDPGFSAVPVDITSGGGGPGLVTVQQFYNLQPGTTYYWRAVDDCHSGPGPASAVFTFTTGSTGFVLAAPFLTSPANGGINTGEQVTFTWDAVGDAIGYQFWLQSSNSSTLSFVADPFTIKSGLQPSSTYTWYVQAISFYSYGLESEHWSFSTGVFAAERSAGRAPQADTRRVLSWLRGGARLVWP